MRPAIIDALAPLRERMLKVVREQEILRVAVNLPSQSGAAAISEAQRQVLAWAQRRSGGRLPKEAWGGAGFDYLAGGRTTLAVRLSVDRTEIWTLRADDPDKTVAGRVWTTEITIGRIGDATPRLSVRLLASTPEEQLDIDPHVPGFLRQLATDPGLQIDDLALRSDAWRIWSAEEVDRLITLLEDPARQLPVFVASGDGRSDHPDKPLIDAEFLARATVGLAHVVVLPATLTYALTDAFGKLRSVYHGAVRVFLPGFDADAPPYDHRLFLSDTLRTEQASAQCVRSLRVFAARESLRRWRLNHDVLTFGSVRTAALRVEQERHSEGTSDADRFQAAQTQMQALDDELAKAKDWEAQLTQLHDEAEARAIAGEAQLRGSIARIQQLEAQLRQRGQDPDVELSLPAVWSDFADWCDEHLIGRVVLSPSARRGVKKAEFEDPALAARCLVWLATECRNRRMSGGGSLSELVVGNTVRNSACGGDAYSFDFRELRLVADWHIKNGGNTRDPSRCLRIYYGWDDLSQQIVIADMPAHRRTGAS